MRASVKRFRYHFRGIFSDDNLPSLYQIKEAIDYAKELDISHIIYSLYKYIIMNIYVLF